MISYTNSRTNLQECMYSLSEKPYNVCVDDDLDIVAIGRRLEELRAARHLSLRQAAMRAKRLGGKISHTHLRDMEMGKIEGLTLPKLRLLASVYEVSLDDIVGVDRPLVIREPGPMWADEDPKVRELHLHTLAIAGHGRISDAALDMLIASTLAVREQVEKQVEEEAKRVRKPKPKGPESPPAPNN